MPAFRCEYEVKGDLALATGLEHLELSTRNGTKTIFRNGPVDKYGHAISLVAIAIGQAPDIKLAQAKLRRDLAEQLDLLSFSTHARFEIVNAQRLLDWEPNHKIRKIHAFHTADSRYPPSPELIRDYLETVEALDGTNLGGPIKTALKYFRYGLVDKLAEDQFMRFWLALEVIAEQKKEKERVAILCPVCEAAWTCSACGTSPTRIPMAKQAIEDLITGLAGEAEGPAISKRQLGVRNSLMHGRSTESIETEFKTPLREIVNELAAITWHAIMSTISLGEGPMLSFGHHGGEFASGSLVMTVEGEFEYDGTDDHPPEDKIPKFELEMIPSFDPTKLNQPDTGNRE